MVLGINSVRDAANFLNRFTVAARRYRPVRTAPFFQLRGEFSPTGRPQFRNARQVLGWRNYQIGQMRRKAASEDLGIPYEEARGMSTEELKREYERQGYSSRDYYTPTPK